MPSPFPGMNPYLEQPEIWSQVHKWLTILIAQTLNPQLRPKYRVAIEERVYESKGDDVLLVGIPGGLCLCSHDFQSLGLKGAREADFVSL
jgi:hypothetical protein